MALAHGLVLARLWSPGAGARSTRLARRRVAGCGRALWRDEWTDGGRGRDVERPGARSWHLEIGLGNKMKQATNDSSCVGVCFL